MHFGDILMSDAQSHLNRMGEIAYNYIYILPIYANCLCYTAIMSKSALGKQKHMYVFVFFPNRNGTSGESSPHGWSELFYSLVSMLSLRWRHDGRDSVSNHQPHDCLLNRLVRRRSKKTSKLRVTDLCVGNSPGTGKFPAQMVSNADNVSIWWRHHVTTDDLATHVSRFTSLPLWWPCDHTSAI